MGIGLVNQWNRIMEKRGADNGVEREFWDLYKSDNLKEWVSRQIPEFYTRAMHVRQMEEQLA